MAYNYNDFLEFVLGDEGQRRLIAMRDHARRILREAGAISYESLTRKDSGDSWETHALVDRLVSLGDLREVAASSRIYVAAGALKETLS